MKVLFAVNNESISESIIKRYQQEYKEIISSKNVYYFDAITRELQKDKTYDRIVISEDVEPFTNNNYGVIDNFIFKRLDAISDEATTPSGQDIPIILICADRRTKSENILVKLFGIGIYSALLGQDRTISKVCELINKPRSKKDAKIYYRIESDDVEYKAESEGDVNEIEIQNILAHYKKLGKNEEEYVKSFDNIAEQYTDAQLRVICKFLPLNVKAVLEANSPKYQELVTFGDVNLGGQKGKYVPNQEYHSRKKKNEEKNKQKAEKLDIIETNIGKPELTKPVVIPGVSGKIKENNVSEQSSINLSMQSPTMYGAKGQAYNAQNNIQNQADEIESILQSVETNIAEQKKEEETPKKRRGRPRKVVEQTETVPEQPKRKRGRPKKVQEEPVQEVVQEPVQNEVSDVNLFDLGNENTSNNGGLILPGLEDDEPATTQSNNQNDELVDLFSLGDDNSNNTINPNNYAQNNTTMQDDFVQKSNTYNNFSANNAQNSFEQYNQNYNANNTHEIESTNQYNRYNDSRLENLLSMSNKLVAFVGTSKNGTSFLVNSMAEILSKKGIKTAILDLTQNKNAYYIYTQNDEDLRKISYSCIENLQRGIVKGIDVSKNLTVFTTLPDKNADFEDYQNILSTLMQNYSLVIMDCDYETDFAYFKYAKEIYLVQSYDILTIQPLTAFLRNLKARNILDPNKLRIVLNKVLRVRSITDRVIIGGMSSYNDPSMSYMTELFDKDNVKYCTIPFDQEAYSRYLDGLVNCEISTKGYPKNIMASLENLGNMIYPLLNNDKPANKFNTYNQRTSNFSNDINETLNKMKNRY